MAESPAGSGRRRQALIVTGMHRSGTSAMARMLNLLGADLPSELMPGVQGDNELGYWEPLDVVRHHDRFLESAGSSWDAVGPLPESCFQSDAAERLRSEILAILERDFSQSELFVIKDPRISRLIPFWESLLAEFDVAPHFVIMIRHPLEVAASLEKRSAFPFQKSLLLWLWHVLEAERASRGASRTFVAFDDLLGDWRQVVARLQRDLGIRFPKPPEASAAGAAIDQFLSAKHRHHVAGDEELVRRQAPPWIAETLAAFEAEGAPPDELGATLDRVARDLQTTHVVYGPVLADIEGRLAARVRECEAAGQEIAVRDQQAAAWTQEAARLQGQLEQTHQELFRAQKALGEAQQQLGHANARAADLEAQLGHANARAADLETRLGHANARAADLETRLGHANARAADLETRLGHANARAADLEAQLGQIFRSKSWKATSYLRRLAALFRGRRAG